MKPDKSDIAGKSFSTFMRKRFPFKGGDESKSCIAQFYAQQQHGWRNLHYTDFTIRSLKSLLQWKRNTNAAMFRFILKCNAISFSRSTTSKHYQNRITQRSCGNFTVAQTSTGFVFFLDSPSTYWQAAKVTYVFAIQWHNLLLPCLRENVRLIGECTSMKSLIAKQVQK